MNSEQQLPSDRETHYMQASSWADDRERARQRSSRIAWLIAGIAIGIAMLEAVALALLTPLKTIVPYTFLVDRNTGYVQVLQGGTPDRIAADEALTQALLAQYVIARESFDIALVRTNFRKVALWSGEPVRGKYLAMMQGSNPSGPLRQLPRTSIVDVRVKSVSPIAPETALVRFETERRDQGQLDGDREAFVAVVRYRFSHAAMSLEDRFINPLGFQVIHYRRDQEALPELRDPAAQPPRSQADEVGGGVTP